MPIFHDPDSTTSSCEFADKLNDAVSRDAAVMRRPSEESIRTQFLDGPLPECDVEPTSPTQEVLTAMTDANLGISDRVELIERIKRGESPTWVPNRTVSQRARCRYGRRTLKIQGFCRGENQGVWASLASGNCALVISMCLHCMSQRLL